VEPLAQMGITAIATFLAASGGFWVYLRRRREAKDANTVLLMGLAHDKIVYFGMKYIEKGFVTKDEYDDLIRYFYQPYIALGGNGTAERIMLLVQRLPLTLENSRIAELADRVKIRAQDEARLQKRENEFQDRLRRIEEEDGVG
jgi:hypothetical protein